MHSLFVRKPPGTKYTKITCIRNILDLQYHIYKGASLRNTGNCPSFQSAPKSCDLLVCCLMCLRLPFQVCASRYHESWPCSPVPNSAYNPSWHCLGNPGGTLMVDPVGKCVKLPGNLSLNGVAEDINPGRALYPWGGATTGSRTLLLRGMLIEKNLVFVFVTFIQPGAVDGGWGGVKAILIISISSATDSHPPRPRNIVIYHSVHWSWGGGHDENMEYHQGHAPRFHNPNELWETYFW